MPPHPTKGQTFYPQHSLHVTLTKGQTLYLKKPLTPLF